MMWVAEISWLPNGLTAAGKVTWTCSLLMPGKYVNGYMCRHAPLGSASFVASRSFPRYVTEKQSSVLFSDHAAAVHLIIVDDNASSRFPEMPVH